MNQTTRLQLLLATILLVISQAAADPGEFYHKQHQILVAEFDSDGDGFLDAQEREKMRATPKPQGKGFRRGGEKPKKKRVRRDMPQHWIDKYDKDGDGGLSDDEAGKGYWTERGILFKNYDQNKNKKLDNLEVAKLKKDIEKEKFTSWDLAVASDTLRDVTKKTEKKKLNLNPTQQAWLKFDLDGDGVASKEEIDAIRKAQN